MSEFIQILKDATKAGKSLDYSDCSKIVRQLLNILNSEEKGKIRIVGQPEMNKRLVSALILNEHVLLEGLPGVAKTTAVKNLAAQTALFYKRVQFIPDMQPSDLIGRRDIIPKNESGQDFEIEWQYGPLFANLILADEINRAPSKVQAALLEAMGEKQITPFGMQEEIISHTEAKKYLKDHEPPNSFKEYGKSDINNKLSTQFSVFATMNPIEIEGTYPLSEAQIDRFCFKTIVHFPKYDHLLKISDKVFQSQSEQEKALRQPNDHAMGNQGCSGIPRQEDFILSFYFLQHCRRVIFEEKDRIYKHIDDNMIHKIAQIVYFSNYKSFDERRAYTNDPEQSEIRRYFEKEEHRPFEEELMKEPSFRHIESGSSPRGVESLLKASLCEAFFDGEEKVAPQHIRSAAYDVLRHRIRLKIQAKTQNITSVDIIEKLLDIFLGRYEKK